MARILNCFVCITIMMTLVYSNKGYSYTPPRLRSLQVTKRASPDSATNDSWVFPGPSSRVADSKFTPIIPVECLAKGYCEKVPNYPTEYIEDLVTKLGDKVQFQMDTLDDSEVQIGQRLGVGTSGEQIVELCKFTDQIIYPQAMPDKSNKWYTVINPDNKKAQGYRVEVCDSPGSSCNGVATMQNGYTGGCKQKYVYRMVEAVDERGSHVMKSLRLPSCCSCVVTADSPFKRR